MRFAEKVSKAPMPAAPAWVEAQIAVTLEHHCYLLNDGRLARQAVTCIITPQVGDRVLVAGCQDGTPYVVHILQRNEMESACLSVPGVEKLGIEQSHISLHCTEQLALHSLRDIEITAATGVLALNARNLFTTVNETLVQNVRNYIGKASQYLLEVKQLLRLHGQQTLITAEKDVKVDGERISMG